MQKAITECWEILPTLWCSSQRKKLTWLAERRFFAIFSVWHGLCKHHFIRWIAPLTPNTRRETTMTNTNFTSRVAAAASAFALSLILISGTVAVPGNARAHDVQVASTYVSVVA
jgi:hypothetical protein